MCKLDIGKYVHIKSNEPVDTKWAQRKTVRLGLWCVWSYVCVMHMLLIFYSTTQKMYMGSKASNHVPIHCTRAIFNIWCACVFSCCSSMRWYLFDGSVFSLHHRRRPNFLLWSVACLYEYHQYIIHTLSSHNISMLLPFDFGTSHTEQASARNIYGNSKACMCLRRVLCVALYLQRSKRKQISCNACECVHT